ncbi:ThiF family adenylyltransferase [Halomarina ordinaria]|uniref:ThiF family adenylyltransferase n=1 Tax=Halomarina ordinaria TaxID=3033939 RepID=A0ABD5UIX7_9EURY|nr:ThiF family adenylyltransferase [Halomarina sp. PSRA2]
MGMSIQDEQTATPATVDEFHVALTKATRETIRSLLFENDRFRSMPERGLIAVLRPSSGQNRVTYLIEEVVPPEQGDIQFDGGLDFGREYSRRARELAQARDEAGLLYLHTHLPGGNTPSAKDTEVARDSLFRDARKLGDDRPFAMGIVTEDGGWSIMSFEFDTPSVAEEVGDGGYSEYAARTRRASAVRIFGDRFQKIPTDVEATGAAAALTDADMEIHDSIDVENFWGSAGQARLSALRVGIVGLGGGGSILAPTLARLGVAEEVLVDFDLVDHANLNRAMGATTVDADVHRPKVQVAARTARAAATNPGFTVREVQASVSEDHPDYGAILDLLDCDIIFDATDADNATRVLDEISHAHLIPVIGGGTDTNVEPGEQTFGERAAISTIVVGPEHTCQRCAGTYDDESARQAMERNDQGGPDNYGVDDVLEDDDRVISMMPTNLVATGLMQLRLLDLVLGLSGGIPAEMRFNPLTWEMRPKLISHNEGCVHQEIIGIGDTVNLNLGTDWTYKRLREAGN